jgi:hypothetical protein
MTIGAGTGTSALDLLADLTYTPPPPPNPDPPGLTQVPEPTSLALLGADLTILRHRQNS